MVWLSCCVANIKVNKASGPDNLPARFLQERAYEIAPVLTTIFQASLDQGVIPTIWKTAAQQWFPFLKKVVDLIIDQFRKHVFVVKS